MWCLTYNCAFIIPILHSIIGFCKERKIQFFRFTMILNNVCMLWCTPTGAMCRPLSKCWHGTVPILEVRCKDYNTRVFCTFLLHHFQSLQGLRVKVLQVLGPTGLYEHILLDHQGIQGLVIVISFWNSFK